MTSLCTYVAYRTGLTKKIIDDLTSSVGLFGNSCLFIGKKLDVNMDEFDNWTYKFEIYTHKKLNTTDSLITISDKSQ